MQDRDGENHQDEKHQDENAHAGCEHDHDHGKCDHGGRDHGDRPRDWIEAFNRHFSPSIHTELTDETSAKGIHMEGEILPWLWLSAELDPQRVETYTVASYWLSEHIGKAAEAERFLRQGLRENPNSYEIMFELGRLYDKHLHDAARARNLWELGLRKWRQQEETKAKPDYFLFEKFTAHLARLEEREGNLAAAVNYLEMLRPHSPEPKEIQRQIEELRAKLRHDPVAGQS